MKFKRLENYETSENTYIVYDEKTLNGIVIDPGVKTEEILNSAKEDNIKIKYVFITHCHYDHIEFMEELRKQTGSKLVCSEKASINIGIIRGIAQKPLFSLDKLYDKIALWYVV